MASEQPTLRRTLGIHDGVFLLIGITIGSGIFRTPGEIATYQSNFGQIAFYWILAGAFMYLGGLIYAELGSRLPETGGEYVYLREGMGERISFIYVWSQLLIIRTGAAAALAITTADYLGHFFPRVVAGPDGALVTVRELGDSAHLAVSLGVIAILGAINIVGVRPAAWYQAFSSVFKVGGLLLLVGLGLSFVAFSGGPSLLGTSSPPTANFGPFGNAASALMLVCFAYLGFDRVGYVAGEMKDPRRAVPISMFFGIAAIVLVYLLANTVYHQVLGMEGVRGAPIVAADTAAKLVPWGAGFVSIVVMVSTTGSINGTMMTATRAYYANAKDGRFFGFLNHIHPDFRTPSRAVIVHCIWAAVIVLVRGGFAEIVAGMTFAVLIFYALNAVTLFRLRAKKIGEEGCYRSPFFPALPIVFIAGIATLLGLRGWFRLADSIKDLAFIVTGIPFALYYCRRGPIGPAGYARLAALEVALVGALYYAYLCADRNSWQFAPIVAVGLAAAAALTVAHVKLDRRTAAV